MLQVKISDPDQISFLCYIKFCMRCVGLGQVKWVTGMAHPQVADGENDLQIRRVAANKRISTRRQLVKGRASNFGRWLGGLRTPC
jgi:hypothetical protein